MKFAQLKEKVTEGRSPPQWWSGEEGADLISFGFLVVGRSRVAESCAREGQIGYWRKVLHLRGFSSNGTSSQKELSWAQVCEYSRMIWAMLLDM